MTMTTGTTRTVRALQTFGEPASMPAPTPSPKTTAPTPTTEDEWRQRLTPEQYRILREKGTERAFTNDNFPNGPGMFRCVCCDAPLFDAETKFDSGTGWPSFDRPVEAAHIVEKVDPGGRKLKEAELLLRQIRDLQVREPEIEETVRRIYKERLLETP